MVYLNKAELNLLMAEVRIGNIEKVKDLLNQEYSPNIQDNLGKSPLCHAVKKDFGAISKV